jgi:signal transduction histidine kinase
MPANRRAIGALLPLAFLGGALIVLATMEYHWIGQLADAERTRMRAGLEFAARHFTDEFDRELTHAFVAFQMVPPDISMDVLLRRYDEWSMSVRNPRLIRAIYFVPRGNVELLHELDLKSHSARAAEWPEQLLPIRSLLERELDGGRRAPPIVPDVGVLIVPVGGAPRVMVHMGHPGPPPFLAGDFPPPGKMPIGGRVVIVIDRDYLATTIVPDLVRRYFEAGGGNDFDVAVAEPSSGKVLYRSDKSTQPFRAEAAFPIFRLLHFVDGSQPPPPLDAGQGWQLLVRHRHGTLEAAVERTRTHNLVLTSSILAILAGSVLFLVVMLRRAERLRAQQMEFVAGVTHELNTPIAALQSAGQNLADGVTSEPRQVERYGAMIVKESRRLGDMVAHVLEYAGMQGQRARRPDERVDVGAVVESSVAHCRWLCEQEQVTVDTQIDAELPPIQGDGEALGRAMQNLIANAVKYGGDGKWVGVRASRNGSGIAIVVEDAGAGVSGEDARHIFEPFYRGVARDRIRGSGLGLTIVKRIVEEHGGTVDVGRSTRGGAKFTVRIPHV